ncbi:hypothetical protein [Streptomyces sp. RLB3-6]|uniref:hypothetical protein n=1 Tax=Streptomyces sp. RLB3-6 TaxID=2594457 RepID=UPI00116383CF|nr:hypothetical protein [Streptomyces sp. RLB3-6]QDN87399.1 hypothetical protein FNV61_18740 [Streptomyces sp. RLB3-6]
MTASTQQPPPAAQVDPGCATFAPARKPGENGMDHARSILRLWDDPHYQATLSADLASEPALTEERLVWYLQRANLTNKPALLWQAFTSGTLSPSALTPVIGGVWCVSMPGCLPFDQWRPMFHVAGYTENGRACPRPPRAVELWRGAPAGRQTGHYWTSHREYAARYQAQRGGQLWRTLAPPATLLCRATSWSTDGFDEYAVDTAALAITPAN